MKEKALPILITCLVVFLIGLTLLLRPQYEARVVEVVDTFTRMEGRGSRYSSRRQPVRYANIRVEVDGGLYDLTVRDKAWIPIKAGDTIVVVRRLFGGLMEYRPDRIYVPTMLAGIIGAVALLIFWVSRERQKS